MAEEIPFEKWRQVPEVNLSGAFLFCGSEMIRRRSDSILNVASVAALSSSPSASPLPVTQSPQEGSRPSRASWRPAGRTMADLVLEASRADIEAGILMDRIGRPDQLNGIPVFLNFDASS